jgi:hypothetical protein
METSHKAIWAHNDRTLRHPILALMDTAEILPCRVRLPDGSRREVEESVTVVGDVGVQFGDPEMGPITTYCGVQVTKSVRPGLSATWLDAERETRTW